MTARRKQPARKPAKTGGKAPEQAPEQAPRLLTLSEQITDATNVVLNEPRPPEIVPEGDFAGLTYDEVLNAVTENLHESLGELSVTGAACAVDRVMQELLMITEHAEGKIAAKEAALKFCETALPFAMLDVSEDPHRTRTLADLRQQFVEQHWGLPAITHDDN